MDMLTTIEIHGYKSIKELNGLNLRPMNVLIGANGSGKSNLISFFKMLNWMTPSPGNFQFYIGKVGGANALLYDGVTITPQIRACLTFQTSAGTNEYFFRLFHAAADTLIFAEEKIRYTPNHFTGDRTWLNLGAGHREAKIIESAEQGASLAHETMCSLSISQYFRNRAYTPKKVLHKIC
jgi:predicted ATPase